MIAKEGDYSLLQEALNHAKLKDCEICQKHAANYCRTCQNYSPLTESMEILTKITITSSNGQKDIPKTLSLELTANVSQEHTELIGDYILQNQMINRFPFWKHNDQNFAIWYDNISECWSIGKNKNLGTSKWIFAGPFQVSKLPNEVSEWKFFQKSKSSVSLTQIGPGELQLKDITIRK